MPSLNWPRGSGEEDENVKSLQTDKQMDGRTDGRTDRRRTTGDQKSPLELLAQVSLKPMKIMYGVFCIKSINITQ